MTSGGLPDRPIRLAAVIDSLGVGGVETGLLDLMRTLDRTRFEPFIWAFRPGGMVPRIIAAGIPLSIGHDRPAEDRTWEPRDEAARVAWTAQLARELAEERIDAVLVYGWPEAVDAARAVGIRAIVERSDGPELATRVLDKSALRAIICESRHVRDILRMQGARLKLDPRRLLVIPNGVDQERFRRTPGDRARARASLGLPPDAYVVGCVARHAREKNLAMLVRAFAVFVARTPDPAVPLRLVLAGPDGGDRAVIEATIAGAGIADLVVLPGPVDDPERVMAALDVFALVSWLEGSPFAMLEAMAMGLPIISTAVGALPEMLADNAIVVDPVTPLATRRAIELLYTDARLRARLGARSLALAKRNSLPRMVARYSRVLEAAVAEATVTSASA